MKCEDLLRALNEFVDGEIDPSLANELCVHLAACQPCKVVVDNVRQTITLYRAGEAMELPLPFREKLHAVLRERWKARHGPSGPLASPPPPPVPPPAQRPSA